MQAMNAASPGTQLTQPCPQEATWIEFCLVDEDSNPVPGAKYKVKLPDGSTQDGALDDKGKVRFDNIVPGQASISFPEIDADEWTPLGAGGGSDGGGRGSDAGGSDGSGSDSSGSGSS
jgi:hypothetical protein